jgi:hypothetical protein
MRFESVLVGVVLVLVVAVGMGAELWAFQWDYHAINNEVTLDGQRYVSVIRINRFTDRREEFKCIHSIGNYVSGPNKGGEYLQSEECRWWVI